MGSGPGFRARVRVRYSARCMERIGLQLDLGSGTDVRVSLRLWFRLEVKPR